MRPTLIELEDFGSFAGSHALDLSAVHQAAVVGDNGAGKSTLVYDALGFAFGGVTRAGDVDSVVRTGADQARCAVTFDVDGHLYRVTRVRQRAKKTAAWVEKESSDSVTGWETVTESKGVRETDETIVSLLGASWDALAATVFAGQGDADRFTGQYGAARRKELLGEIIGLGEYTMLSDRARQTAAEARAVADRERGRLDDIAEQLKSADTDRETLEGLAGRVAAADAAADAADGTEAETAAVAKAAVAVAAEAKAAVAGAAREMETLASAAKAARRAAESAEGRAVATAKRAADAANAAAPIPDAQERRAALTVKISDLETLIEGLKADGETAAATKASAEALAVSCAGSADRARARVTQLNEAGHGDCPTCGQDLSDQHLSVVVAEAETEAETADSEAGGHTRTAVSAAEERERLLGEYKTAKASLASLSAERDDLDSRVDATQAAAAVAVSAAADAATAAAEAADDETAAAEAEAAVAAFAAVDRTGDAANAANEAETAETVAAEAHAAAVAARRDHAQAAQEHAALAERVAAHAAAEARRDTVEAAFAVAENTASVHTTLARAFGRDGVPALIFDGVVIELSEAVNDVLARLSNGRLGVTISTTRETKAGTTADALDVTVHGPDGPRPYESFSGGERFRVDLALRVGLSRLLARRSGTQIRTLILDEGWGALDDEGIGAMVECLRLLSDEFDLLLTVTHLGEVAEAFPVKIRVDRPGTGSKVLVDA